jgi:hypothetical protein
MCETRGDGVLENTYVRILRELDAEDTARMQRILRDCFRHQVILSSRLCVSTGWASLGALKRVDETSGLLLRDILMSANETLASAKAMTVIVEQPYPATGTSAHAFIQVLRGWSCLHFIDG